MKTPREILLEQHRSAEFKLDAIRQSTVTAVGDRCLSSEPAGERRSPTVTVIIGQTLWRELIRPARFIWAGLAVTWLLILVANLNFRANAQPMTATALTHSADFIQMLREQEQMMVELTGTTELNAAGPVLPSKRPASHPRSELRGWFFVI